MDRGLGKIFTFPRPLSILMYINFEKRRFSDFFLINVMRKSAGRIGSAVPVQVLGKRNTM